MSYRNPPNVTNNPPNVIGMAGSKKGETETAFAVRNIFITCCTHSRLEIAILWTERVGNIWDIRY
jgi:hypothetical protein